MSEYTDKAKTITGNLTKDPELRFTPTGKAVCNIDIAENIRKEGKEDETKFWNRIAVWDSMAENAAESLHKGDRVVVVFYSKPDTWTDRDGKERQDEKHTAIVLGAELRWATVQITKNKRN